MAGPVVIVGAGMAGLSAALTLSAAGVPVEVIEKEAVTGGKARARMTAAGPADTGPTVFTQRGVFDALLGRVEDHIALRPLDLLARHVFADGAMLDLFTDRNRSAEAIAAMAGPAEADRFRAFAARAERLFCAFEAPVMQSPRPTPFGVARAVLGNATGLLRDMAPLRTLRSALESQFRDPRLIQLFARYATYVGGSPFLTPALLMLIWRSEEAGVWAVEGGMAGLARALTRAAEARGVVFRLGDAVAEIETAHGAVTGLRLAGGGRVAARAVLFNGDPAALPAGLLGEGVRGAAPAMPLARRSLSALVWCFAGQPGNFPLAHHMVVFPAESRSEFEDIFGQRRLPRDPAVYLCAQDRGFGVVEGPERLEMPERFEIPERFEMIVNAPATGDTGGAGEKEIAECTERVFSRLAKAGLRLADPGRGALTTPAEFAQAFPGTGGAIYGAHPHGMMAAFRRPTARTPVRGLYLAGGGTHPGPGVPMAALSGRHAAAAILSDRALT